ncbi:hypothetical protein, conserved [Babesia ovata]|uniref:Uncharacterized protein n=1 Tax=Babesia ovata TaxID=189622 RepID=A0A2H6KKD0_9APIC|nr:uncharacterized protein BOVATA_049470 [Babesia ovata]GBE63454.1 hypothetical protein, conserved [Babesia ovata]
MRVISVKNLKKIRKAFSLATKKQGEIAKQNENPKKLLDNLCLGLEKFLGFNPDSKGYDGTGIVYSDLDRLCDGVMAFLHGVLSGVKGDENVTTYDDNHDINITKTINKLNDSVGKGREAFEKAVSQVEERTGDVTRHLEALKHDIKQHKENIDADSEKSLIIQVDEWSTRAGQYIRHVEQADEASKKLDPQLSGDEEFSEVGGE